MDFEQTYQEYFTPVFNYVMCRTKNIAAAEDIAGKIWIKVFENTNTFNPSKGNIRQWLFTIARNEVTFYFRLYHIRNFFSLTDKEETIANYVDNTEYTFEQQCDTQTVIKAMSALTKKEQDIISLKFYSGLGNKEIAKITKLSPTNISTIANRAITKLRAAINEESVSI